MASTVYVTVISGVLRIQQALKKKKTACASVQAVF